MSCYSGGPQKKGLVLTNVVDSGSWIVTYNTLLRAASFVCTYTCVSAGFWHIKSHNYRYRLFFLFFFFSFLFFLFLFVINIKSLGGTTLMGSASLTGDFCPSHLPCLHREAQAIAPWGEHGPERSPRWQDRRRNACWAPCPLSSRCLLHRPQRHTWAARPLPQCQADAVALHISIHSRADGESLSSRN